MTSILRSPPPTSITLHDPYELERLAEELASREQGRELGENNNSYNFPAHVPLTHDNPHLTAPQFNVEEFLLSQSYTSLLDLRKELRDYLASLKEELVQLINDDYEAFISLSTDLQREGVRLHKIKEPLLSLKEQIVVSRNELLLVQDAIQDKLNKRTKLREEKALLQLLMRISDSIVRLETLLHITLPDASPTKLHIPSQYTTGEGIAEERSRSNRAKHLSRIASEYTQLLYHTEKARREKCKFVDEVQWRLDRIQSTISSDLDHLFGSTLKMLTEHKKETTIMDVEKSKWMADITECLRSYDVLHLWRDAEDVLRREVVRGFVKKTIHAGALSGPHSPIVPHTPLPTFSNVPNSALPPRTPYTPFTAFPLRQNGHIPITHSGSPYVHILNSNDDPLANLYSQILRFVERDLINIIRVVEKIALDPLSNKPKQALELKDVSASNGVLNDGFQITANVIWEEIGRAIMDELGNGIFASGRPDEFRKNYELSQAFLRSLEYLCPSIAGVEALRTHSLYIAFENRWQLSVYFQLRWKEIVAKLDEVLGSQKLGLIPVKAKQDFASAQASAVWVAFSACWSAEVFIPGLSDRFWRLSLQILSRYKIWLVEILSGVSSSGLGVRQGETRFSGAARLSSRVLSADTASPELLSAEEETLKGWTALVIDIRSLNENILTLWKEEVSIILPGIEQQSDATKLEDSLQHALGNLTSYIPCLSHEIMGILARRCCEALFPIRSIPTHFRSTTSKKPPTEASYFISSILKPIKSFFGIGSSDGLGSVLREEFMIEYAAEIVEVIIDRYVEFLTAIKKNEESLRRLNKGKKSGFSLFGNTSKEDEGDEERIRAQLVFDVQAFGKELELFGLKLADYPSYQALLDLAQSNDAIDAVPAQHRPILS